MTLAGPLIFRDIFSFLYDRNNVVFVGLFKKGRHIMNKKIKLVGKGFIYGVKHPFTDKGVERTNDMTFVDGLFGDIGMSVSQAVIQNAIAFGELFAIMFVIGYINSKIEKTSLNVKMTVDEKK